MSPIILRNTKTTTTSNYHLHVWPLLRRPAQRFLLPDWLAITIGSHIFSWRGLDYPELVHELTHVIQWQENGHLGYIVRYLLSSRKNGYRGNRFEVEAYAAEATAREQENQKTGQKP